MMLKAMKLASTAARKVEKLELSNSVCNECDSIYFTAILLADSLHIYMALRSSSFSYPTSQIKENITLTILMMVESRD